jgi:hypothetical protein
MQNSQLRFGIVGTGMIAGFIADPIDKSTNAKLIAVSGRQIDTAQSFVAKGVAFMDATHLVHHPRTAAIQAVGVEKIGSARSLNTKFYFPFSDRTNIRYNVEVEPDGRTWRRSRQLRTLAVRASLSRQ